MLDPTRDARVLELSFLAKLERAEGQSFAYRPANTQEKQLLLHLLHEGYINGRDTLSECFDEPEGEALDTRMESAYQRAMQKVERQLLANQQAVLVLGHKGRLRLAELEELLSTGRDRDPTGTFVARRYFDRDLAVALTRASTELPVCLAIVDMNGLKTLNDRYGHLAGDEAIRRYLTTIAAVLPQGATGYRGEGGDEVFVVSRGVSARDFIESLRTAVKALNYVLVQGQTLSAACGICLIKSPLVAADEALRKTDQAQYRAKAATRTAEGRCSTLAVEDETVELL